MRTLLYCQHSLGIGHLARTLLLAKAFADLGPVRLIIGGHLPPCFRVDPRIKVVDLPPLALGSDGQLRADRADTDVDQRLRARARRAGIAAAEFAPDAVIVEMFPFGRKKFALEILELIRRARRRPDVKIFSSVRDILVTRGDEQSRYDQRAAKWLNQHFDGVLVHSDPSFTRLERSFSAVSSLAVPIYYTGYVANAFSVPCGEQEHRVVVSAGGGRVGHALLRAAVEASDRIHTLTGMQTLVLGGALGDIIDRGMRDSPMLALRTSVPDLAGLLSASAVSVSQCGYNTMTDVLSSGIPSVVVPFEAPGEDEQLQRAELLQRSGRVALLRERDLSATALAEAVCALPRERHSVQIDLDGAAKSAALLAQLVDPAADQSNTLLCSRVSSTRIDRQLVALNPEAHGSSATRPTTF